MKITIEVDCTPAEARAFMGEQAEHREVRVGFHCISHFVVDPRKRLIEAAVVIENRACRIDIKGSAVLLDQGAQFDIVAEE